MPDKQMIIKNDVSAWIQIYSHEKLGKCENKNYQETGPK
jgi:hypothetical protein